MLGCDRDEGSDGLGVRRKQAAGGGQGLSVGWSRREAGGGGEDEPIAQRLGWAGDAAGVREGLGAQDRGLQAVPDVKRV